MIYNLLPENLRSMNTDTFKNQLDTFLATITDQLTVTGLGRAPLTSSLLHQLPMSYNLTN